MLFQNEEDRLLQSHRKTANQDNVYCGGMAEVYWEVRRVIISASSERARENVALVSSQVLLTLTLCDGRNLESIMTKQENIRASTSSSSPLSRSCDELPIDLCNWETCFYSYIIPFLLEGIHHVCVKSEYASLAKWRS